MSNQEKIQNLKRDIIRYRQACNSPWPRPIDYMNLIDAQHELRALELAAIKIKETRPAPKPIPWYKLIKPRELGNAYEANHV